MQGGSHPAPPNYAKLLQITGMQHTVVARVTVRLIGCRVRINIEEFDYMVAVYAKWLQN
jgi:hypothetical protein